MVSYDYFCSIMITYVRLWLLMVNYDYLCSILIEYDQLWSNMLILWDVHEILWNLYRIIWVSTKFNEFYIVFDFFVILIELNHFKSNFIKNSCPELIFRAPRIRNHTRTSKHLKKPPKNIKKSKNESENPKNHI